MYFAFAMLICRARNALPMSTWHLTAICMSGFKHTQFHKSFTFQVCSYLAERLPVACLNRFGCVITCGEGICLHGRTLSGFISGWVCMLWVILCALGGSLLLAILMVQILHPLSHCASSVPKTLWQRPALRLAYAPGF